MTPERSLEIVERARRAAELALAAADRIAADVSGEIRLTRPFRPHRRAPYAEQVASCGCWWSTISGDHVGELCERRLTGPRCTRTDGCHRPAGHEGACEWGTTPFETSR